MKKWFSANLNPRWGKPVPRWCIHHTLDATLLVVVFIVPYPQSATILVVIWSANGNGSALTSKASSKVKIC